MNVCNKESSVWQYIVNDGKERDGERWEERMGEVTVPPTLTHTQTHHQIPTHDTKYYFSYIQLIIMIIKE